MALYIFFFPQLIAGPILRWSAIAPQIAFRQESCAKFTEGIRRFVYGLSKKMLIANVVAEPADLIFALPSASLNPALAWLGVACYTLQIYFDFSGYSDMAIGLGKMFGFEFIENFNYPYISQSVREFWRRWHISLSSWFRDYLYIPLGGNRCSNLRNHINLVIVFLLCGLWHGASWTFVFWGAYHGLFLVLERMSWGVAIERLPRVIRHGYTLTAVMIGWVFFRADSFQQAIAFVRSMSGLSTIVSPAQPLARYMTHQVICAVVAGITFSTPAWTQLQAAFVGLSRHLPKRAQPTLLGTCALLEVLFITSLLLVSIICLAGGTYNPFIYYRF